MSQKHFKTVRLSLGVAILILFICYFLVTNSQRWLLLHGLGHLQLVPALMMVATSLLPLLILLILTLLLGRIYCSALCPLGLLQDVGNRLSKFFRKKKKRFTYSKPNTIARYGILAVAIIAWVVGFNAVVSLLDPYGAFGRIAANLMRPLYYAINNLLAFILNKFDIYSVYNMTLQTVTVAAAIVAGVTLLVIAVASVLRGRWYCNTICPVGTLLGLVSKLSFFKIKIDDGGCNSCGLCAMNCKAQCINSKTKQVDETRCVACYNCLSVCNRNAIKLRNTYKKKETSVDTSKRTAMVAGAMALAAIPSVAVAQTVDDSITNRSDDDPLMPPGAQNRKNFKNRCTACHLCVSKCPAQVIVPSFLEYGLSGVLQPRMDYTKSFCTYDCTICSRVCPNGALQPLTSDEKRDLQIGQAIFDRELCVVYTDETDCGACSEHCPTQAVHMVLYKNGLRIPKVDTSICVGCGGCQYICPVRPRTAIFVQGSKTQVALNIKEDKPQEEIKVDDFGF